MYRYEQIARKYLSVVSTSGPEFLSLCPFHNDTSPSFRFNAQRGVWICYSCGLKGNARSFLKRIGSSELELSASQEIIDAQIAFLQLSVDRTATKETYLPETILRRYAFEHDAWHSLRRFDDLTIKTWQLGYDPVTDRLAFPLRNMYGGLLGVAYRRLDNGRNKYVYPKHFKKINNLFGSWRKLPKGKRKVALVEGPLDAIRCWQAKVPAYAIYGSYFSANHLVLLNRLDIEEVVTFYDNDEAGWKATDITRSVVKEILVSSVDWSGFRVNIDPGKLSTNSIRKLWASTYH